jgi:hypothetical protein
LIFSTIGIPAFAASIMTNEYKNGTLLVSANNHATPASSGTIKPYGISEVSNPGNFNCYNFRVYNRALSASEVLQNYNALKGRYGL